jgi:hypothetical protein
MTVTRNRQHRNRAMPEYGKVSKSLPLPVRQHHVGIRAQPPALNLEYPESYSATFRRTIIKSPASPDTI